MEQKTSKINKDAVRYPEAISLFEFCKDALRYRFNDRVRVIDQDVGTLVGFEPADCSHWKRGKKDVRSLIHLKSISKNLEVDDMIPVAVALGEMTAQEAAFELKGYISHKLGAQKAHNLKKKFFHQPHLWKNEDLEKPFDQVFEIKYEMLKQYANKLLSQAEITEAPVDVFRLINCYSHLSLEQNKKQGLDGEISLTIRPNKTSSGSSDHLMSITGHLESPYLRFFMMKQLFTHLYRISHESLGELSQVPEDMLEEHSCVFAMYVLVPDEVLAHEIQNLTQEYDVIQQLAENFMVSTSLINMRLWQLS